MIPELIQVVKGSGLGPLGPIPVHEFTSYSCLPILKGSQYYEN